MRASSRKAMINGGGREGYGALRATHLAFSAAYADSLPAPAPAAITVGPPALEPWAGSPLARV